jgi:peptidyl-prolyl cis-trans isomerase D
MINMTQIASIDGQAVEATDFIKYLKLTNQYDTLIEEFLLRRVAISAAPSENAAATDEQVQDTADKLRRVLGLHKAKDMLEYLDQQGLDVSDFEDFVRGVASVRNINEKVASEDEINGYYAKHEPSFRQADISIIVLHKDDEAKANEIAMTAQDIPEDFMAMAIEHSVDDESVKSGGRMGFVNHNELNDGLANAVFAAEAGDIVGPIPDADESFLQIVMVHEVRASSDDTATRRKIAKALYEEWLEEVSSNVDIKVL